jgi:hypothetical protein
LLEKGLESFPREFSFTLMLAKLLFKEGRARHAEALARCDEVCRVVILHSF